MRRAPPIDLEPGEKRTLERWAVTGVGRGRLARRSRIVLEAAEGRTNAEIAAELSTSPETVARWRSRFVVNGLEGMQREAPRGGGARRVPSDVVAQVLEATTDPEATPPTGWTTRSLARTLHVNHMLVHRVWQAHGLQGRDPAGAPTTEDEPAPAIDLAGVILIPGVRAAVFAVGRGSTGAPRPGRDLPLEVFVPELAAHPGASRDRFVRHLRRLERVPARRLSTDRTARPALVFLRALEARASGPVRLDLVVDRRASRLDPRLVRWLAAHPKFRLYAPADGRSWSANVATWFERWTRHGAGSVRQGSFAEFERALAGRRAPGTPRLSGRLAWVGPPTAADRSPPAHQ